MLKYNIEIPTSVYYIMQKLEKNGYEVFIVGGYLRDSILGRKTNDCDICTSALPEEILKIFKNEKTVLTGLKHGTITVVIDKEAIEITTYRIDGNYSDNRRPDNVTFTKNLIEDLKRRDFTINAMAYNPRIGLVDPFGGIKDIENKKIQCVGNPKDRFNEDALRILRAIRFASQLNFVIDENTRKEIQNQYQNLANISIERINSEFCKIILSEAALPQLIIYNKVFSLFIPELKDLIGFKQNNPYHIYNVFNHSINALNEYKNNDLIIKLALFFHDFGKPHCYQDDENGIRHFKGHGKISAEMTDSIMKRLRFDNETRKNVVELVQYHDATFEVNKKHVKKWLNKIGEVQFRRLLEVRKADIKGQNLFYDKKRIEKINNIEKILEEVLQEQECFSLKNLAVNGNDIKEIMNLKEGKEIGYWLNEILKAVINNELKNDREELIQWMTGNLTINSKKPPSSIGRR